MGLEGHRLHVFIFPLLAHGHMIPTLDIARLFTARGAKIAIATTPLNAPIFTKAIETSKAEINVEVYKFPAKEAGLPQGVENYEYVNTMEMATKFFKAIEMHQETLEQLLNEFKPSCLVADLFFPWATDVADKFGIPRLVFHGSNFFSFCVEENLKLYEPYKDIASDNEVFVVPNLPDEIKLTIAQLPEHLLPDVETDLSKLVDRCIEAERKSYGVIMNRFCELESAYVDYCGKVRGRRVWPLGPVSLCNRNIEDKVQRGKKASVDEYECLQWLDSKEPNSVIYVCFGSITKGSMDQEADDQEWLPKDFEKRMEGKGLIIRGWAPQVLILDHEATGGFVTHCGWNSMLEGIAAGVSMVAWPVFAEQVYNEKLVTRVPKTEKAVKQIMVGEEAEEVRDRAEKLREMARRAVEEGGSSYYELSALIQELSVMLDNMTAKDPRPVSV
ncbi:hypothetical protein Ancab_039420 [Ancistrocladus abbreviatus]